MNGAAAWDTRREIFVADWVSTVTLGAPAAAAGVGVSGAVTSAAAVGARAATAGRALGAAMAESRARTGPEDAWGELTTSWSRSIPVVEPSVAVSRWVPAAR